MKKLIAILMTSLFFASCAELNEFNPADLSSIQIEPRAGGPVVTTNSATLVTSLTATSGGNVSSSGGGGQVTQKGVCYDTNPNPDTSDPKVTGGSGSGPFTCIINGLNGSTLYYARAYAIKGSTTYYGNQVTFTTLTDFGTISDVDGNTYNTININGQVWMRENLKTTKYRNGILIPHVTDDIAWSNQTSGAFCNYDNNESNVSTYGRLYNWYTVSNSNQLAPSGWHIPSNDEWQILINYLGGENLSGGKAKETGTSHWIAPNTGADNASGFFSLPGGHRYVNLNPCPTCNTSWFSGVGLNSDWWTSTLSPNGNNAYFKENDNASTQFYRSAFIGGIGYYDKRTGYSIRCLKD